MSLRFALLSSFLLLLGCSGEREAKLPASAAPRTVGEIKAARDRMDETVWAREVQGMRHHGAFYRMWDDLRRAPERGADDRGAVLGRFPFESFQFGEADGPPQDHDGIRTVRWREGGKRFSHAEWEALVAEASARYTLEFTDWQQTFFDPGTGGANPPTSEVAFTLHFVSATPPERVAIRGTLRVAYSSEKDEFLNPRPAHLTLLEATIQSRAGAPPFREAFSYQADGGNDVPPILVQDLDGDGRSDVVFPATNVFFRNQGNFKFQQTDFCAFPLQTTFEACLADWNGDGVRDYLAAGLGDGDAVGAPSLYLFVSDTKGQFSAPPRKVYSQAFEGQCCFAAGDIDGDHDLDLYVGKYLPPYVGGQMPTPFYDANDGLPANLLLNDGQGLFTDATVGSGLEPKRTRRTFRASFLEWEGDGDLDLLLVNDFQGIDVFRNDGRGHFSDVTAQAVDEPANFGMSHTLADYDRDGDVDLYVTGMYSTTVRRLEREGMSLPDRPDVQQHRMRLGFGNRMYMNQGETWRQPPYVASTAQSGWSWGVTSADFDNDGDPDIYVANGHIAGATTKDYDSRYWRHDIYSGSSKRDPLMNALYLDIMSQMTKEYSWNGFEHNRLFRNDGSGFTEVSHVLGVGLEAESRQIISEDFDQDGWPDLLVGTLDRVARKKSFHVYRNAGNGQAKFIGVRLEPAPGRSALGARITVRGPGYQQAQQVVAGDSFFSQHSWQRHFGLGAVPSVDELEVRWPDGAISRIERPGVGRYHVIRAAEAK